MGVSLGSWTGAILTSEVKFSLMYETYVTLAIDSVNVLNWSTFQNYSSKQTKR